MYPKLEGTSVPEGEVDLRFRRPRRTANLRTMTAEHRTAGPTNEDSPHAAAIAVGLATWFTVGRYASLEDAEGYARFPTEYLAIFAAAAILGFGFPGRARQIAWGMAGTHAAAAIFTTPRGDGDGLWTLIFVWIALTGVAFYAAAHLSGRLRCALTKAFDRAEKVAKDCGRRHS